MTIRSRRLITLSWRRLCIKVEIERVLTPRRGRHTGIGITSKTGSLIKQVPIVWLQASFCNICMCLCVFSLDSTLTLNDYINKGFVWGTYFTKLLNLRKLSVILPVNLKSQQRRELKNAKGTSFSVGDPWEFIRPYDFSTILINVKIFNFKSSVSFY